MYVCKLYVEYCYSCHNWHTLHNVQAISLWLDRPFYLSGLWFPDAAMKQISQIINIFVRDWILYMYFLHVLVYLFMT